MTKKLSAEQKKKNRLEKKEIRKQQKAASKTVKKIEQLKGPPEVTPPTPPPAVNLCDDCAYEFGECEGIPKFGEEENADNVIECPAFVNVAKLPTAEEAAAQGPAAAEGEARVCDIEHLGNYPDCFRDCPKEECDGVPAAAKETIPEIVIVCSGGCGKTTEGMTFETKSGEFKEIDESGVPKWTCQECLDKQAGESEEEPAEPEVQVIRTDLPERPDPKRFLTEEDFGTCQCGRLLKRTALNRYQDAIRCVNPRCPAYRVIVKTISTGVK